MAPLCHPPTGQSLRVSRAVGQEESPCLDGGEDSSPQPHGGPRVSTRKLASQETAPTVTQSTGTGQPLSPSSSCCDVALVGSWLRGFRWHLASLILKRAFCLMGVPGVSAESQSAHG